MRMWRSRSSNFRSCNNRRGDLDAGDPWVAPTAEVHDSQGQRVCLCTGDPSCPIPAVSTLVSKLQMRKRILRSSVLLLPLILGGCNSALETGYLPRRLGDSDAARRAYYDSPFTPEARAAELERQEDFEQRRPGPNG